MYISRLWNRLRPPAPQISPLPRPLAPICVIGDLHGRLDLLNSLLERLDREPEAAAARLVFVGDLVDRGPDSAGVLARLRALEAAPHCADITVLMGNHERMMLDFLADPIRSGAHWLGHGGEATLNSFGLFSNRPAAGEGAAARLTGLRDALHATLPDGTADWLANRPLYWAETGFAVSHAGADPERALDQQPAANLLWGHRDFLRRHRRDGMWIAHGHTIVAHPHSTAGRIAVDTGAYRSGRLSAAWLDANGLRFISVTAPGDEIHAC